MNAFMKMVPVAALVAFPLIGFGQNMEEELALDTAEPTVAVEDTQDQSLSEEPGYAVVTSEMETEEPTDETEEMNTGDEPEVPVIASEDVVEVVDESVVEDAVPEVVEETVAPEEPAVVEVDVVPEVQPVVEAYPVTLNFSETDLLVVLSTLAELKPNTSVVVAPGIQGAVTINIKQVPWERALRLILEPRGLTYELEDNIYMIRQSGEVVEVAEEQGEVNPDLVVKLMTAEDFEAMSNEKARSLYGYKPGDAPITDEQIRKELLEAEVPFIKLLQVQEQPTSEVLQAIARAGELNYSLSKPDPAPVAVEDPNAPPPFVDIDITLALKNIALEDALTMIASRGGYACFFKKGIWEIAPNTGAVLKPLVLEHFEVEYLEVGNTLITALQSSLTSRGSITPGMSKVIIVKDTEDGIEQVRRTLKTMDKPTPQVLIEARFFELTTNDEKDVGIDWSKTLGTGMDLSGNRYLISNDGNDLIDIDSQDDIAFTGNHGVSASTAIFETSQLQAVLKAMKTLTTAEQLSNPKLIVASDKQATIHIGEQEPIIDATVSEGDSGTTIAYSLNESYGGEKSETITLLDEPPPANTSRVISGYLDLGTKLTVAPSVKTDEDIYMKVLPKLTSKIRDKTVIIGEDAGGGDIELTFPEINVTSVYSEFSLKSGQTVAIGGLVKNEDRKTVKKVPILSSIPILGRFFTYTTTVAERSETVVFLTVKIVGSEKLRETSGVPVSSELAQPVIDEIREQDGLGAEYIDVIEEEEEETMLPDWVWDIYMELSMNDQIKQILRDDELFEQVS